MISRGPWPIDNHEISRQRFVNVHIRDSPAASRPRAAASQVRERHPMGLRSLWRVALASVLTVAAAFAVSGTANAAGTGPCDIYASGGTPCVAAHSTTR